MSDEERPVHVVVDCSGWNPKEAPREHTTQVPVTDEEWEAIKASSAQPSELVQNLEKLAGQS